MTEIRRAVPTEDEDSVKKHIEDFNNVQELTEKKKELVKKYKEIKQKNQASSKVDAINSLFQKLNHDLGMEEEPKQSKAKQISTVER